MPKKAALKLPNILITGTPGTGKTTTAQAAAERTGLKYINCGDLVKEHECHEGVDEEGFDAFVLDEDKLCDIMEPMMEEGGCIVDFHTPEIFPERCEFRP
jgi:adenylate kinase